ncbi:hypothetical protein CLV82_2212 [Zeaxanthinibacter enoshimensis]|uniref:Uncharacterized protein n=2 Tax=Zeaxanthinibacter enoshimensis TaxID=392009 RepID=A0A4R6TKM5_9FLAO|nr:hypothetical protein CLV82_2212 [Zeaxanthinibacter enoshimensis]
MSMPANQKKKHLILGIVLDLVGMASFFIPGIGMFLDIIWAPIAAWFMTRMYKGQAGKTAGVVTFIEEILPGMDVVPTFTLMWIYTYVIRKQKTVEAL